MAVTAVTHVCRAVLLCATAWAVAFPAAAQQQVQAVWDCMRASAWVKHDTFEPSLVFVTFTCSIFFFWLLDVPLGIWTRRWRATTNPSINPDDMKAWRWEGGKRVLHEGLLYIAPIALFDFAFPRRQLPETAPSAAQLGCEVLLSLFLYDLLFTAGHLLCHKMPWIYRHCHAKHHRTQAVRACETICLTVWEEALDVACSIAALNLCRAHPMSRCVYNVVIVYLLTELHSGYEMPWMLQDVVPCGIWAGSRMHSLHHQRGTVGFQKLFTYLDRLMGTYPGDRQRRALKCN